MQSFLKTSLILLFITISIQLYAEGFLKTSGKKIIDQDGNEIILRGYGLGGWMLQEGYMLETSSFANTQHEIKAKIEELIGKEGMEEFYDAWLHNHMQKADVDSLKVWGFNSIRLPMHYNLFTLPIEDEPVEGVNTWLEKGFELTDSLLSWCEDNEMYLILDLHATPGGQGEDAAISDYDDTKPSLWESKENRDKTVQLWHKLAQHYADKVWIGGYDLINETNWNLPNNNALLKELYLEITDSIRAVDTNHIIFIEGNWWANDFTGLTPPWDNNMVYSFHKYWSYNNKSTIQWMINIRNDHNIPIWCGESGENSNKWFTDAVKLLEENDIGWAWWPLKKIGSISCPLMVEKTEEYQNLLDYWEGRGSKPTVEFAKNALMQMTENLKIENCVFHKDVVDALIRQTVSDEVIPFDSNILPGRIYAVDYDLGENNNAYFDTEVQNLQVSTGTWTGWNSGWTYRNDGVDIEVCQDTETNGYNIGWIESGEWLQYTVHVLEQNSYNMEFRIASLNGGCSFHIELDGEDISGPVTVPKTNGWQTWKSVYVQNINLNKGNNIIKIVVDNGGFNFNYFQTTDYVGFNNIFNEDKISIYPNPFSEYAVVHLINYHNEVYNLEIIDLYGKSVNKVTGIYSENIYIYRENYVPGVYILSLTSDEYCYQQRIIIN